MKVILLHLLLFCSIVVKSQNYNIITPGNDRFFITETNQIVGIRIKQTTPLANGNEYYNYSYVEQQYGNNFEDCAYKIIPSWLGKKVIAQNNGLHILFNKNNDSIFINASAIQNDTWKLYSDSSNSYIEATVIDIIEDSVMYSTDSVKIIMLQHKDSFGNNIQGNWNGTEIRLSKNYGWHKAFNVYEFPYSTTNYELTKYSIPTYTDIYDFAVGDTFQFYKRWNSYMISYEEYVTKVILSKNIDTNNGNISYLIYRNNLTYKYQPKNAMPPYICCDTFVFRNIDTVQAEYENILLFSTMPNEPSISSNASVFTMKIQNIYCSNRLVSNSYYLGASLQNPTDTCLKGIIDGGGESTKFVSGIGDFYFLTSFGSEVNSSLHYYSGCYLNDYFTNTREPIIKNNIRIYPNPVSSKLFISNSNTSTLIRIFNLHGKLVYENYNIDVIEVSEWHNGLYFIEINNNNIISTAKILVQH